MNAPEPAQSFEAARRRHLIEATIETLADVGFKAASLAEIARRANVSTGLFAHYFGDKDGLLEATLRFMASRLPRATAARLRAAATPRDRLLAVAEAALAEEEFDRRTSAVWLAFWGQIMHSAPYRRVQAIYQRRMLSNLRHGLGGLVEPSRVEGAARLIAATIDGLWLQSHAVEGPHDGRDARAMVRDLVDVLIAEGAAGRQPRDGATPNAPPRRMVLVLQNPATGERLGERRVTDVMEVDAAVARARAGLDAWRGTPPGERRRVLGRVAEALRANAGALIRLESQNTGRPVSELAAFDLARAASAFERAADFAGRPVSERVAFDATTFGYLAHPAPSIVACVGDDATPLLSACRQAAAALAAGDAVIFTPPAHAPLTAERLAELLSEAGLPAGAFTVVHGDAETARLVREHRAIAGRRRAPAPSLQAAIVLDDADIPHTAEAILRGPRAFARSRPLSETVVFVQETALPGFERELAALATSLRLGDPLDPRTEIGAVLSERHLEAALDALESATAAGARLLCGGRRGLGLDGGAFLEATVVGGCKFNMRIARGGLFAPIVAVVAFRSEDEAVDRLRQQGRPIAAGVFGANAARARDLAARLDAGVACVNDFGGFPADSRIDDWLDGVDESDDGAERRVLARYAVPPDA